MCAHGHYLLFSHYLLGKTNISETCHAKGAGRTFRVGLVESDPGSTGETCVAASVTACIILERADSRHDFVQSRAVPVVDELTHAVTREGLIAVRALKNRHQSLTTRVRVVRDQLEQLTGALLRVPRCMTCCVVGSDEATRTRAGSGFAARSLGQCRFGCIPSARAL